MEAMKFADKHGLTESVELEEAKSKDIVKGLTDMDGPFTVVAIKNNKVIKQENTKMRNMLPAIVKMMRKEVGVNVTIAIEDRKGTIRNTFKEDVEQVDELSSNTLRSYVAKAKQNTDHNKRGKRTDGIGDALSRLDARSRLKRKADTSPEERAISKRLATEDIELTESFEFQFADKETAQKFMREISQKRLGSSTGTSDGKVRTEGPAGAGVGSPTRAHQEMAKIMKKHGGKLLRTDEGPSHEESL